MAAYFFYIFLFTDSVMVTIYCTLNMHESYRPLLHEISELCTTFEIIPIYVMFAFVSDYELLSKNQLEISRIYELICFQFNAHLIRPLSCLLSNRALKTYLYPSHNIVSNTHTTGEHDAQTPSRLHLTQQIKHM